MVTSLECPHKTLHKAGTQAVPLNGSGPVKTMSCPHGHSQGQAARSSSSTQHIWSYKMPDFLTKTISGLKWRSLQEGKPFPDSFIS